MPWHGTFQRIMLGMRQQVTNEYDAVFERLACTARDSLATYVREADSTRRFMSLLLESSLSARGEILADPRCCSLSLVNSLLSHSSTLWATQPSAAIDAASLATRLADRL